MSAIKRTESSIRSFKSIMWTHGSILENFSDRTWVRLMSTVNSRSQTVVICLWTRGTLLISWPVSVHAHRFSHCHKTLVWLSKMKLHCIRDPDTHTHTRHHLSVSTLFHSPCYFTVWNRDVFHSQFHVYKCSGKTMHRVSRYYNTPPVHGSCLVSLTIVCNDFHWRP